MNLSTVVIGLAVLAVFIAIVAGGVKKRRSGGCGCGRGCGCCGCSNAAAWGGTPPASSPEERQRDPLPARQA